MDGLKKNTFAQTKRDYPFEFWKSYLNFKATIRHELIHAVDPNKFEYDKWGTGSVATKYGYVGYINDPNRTEFRAHLGEWDTLTNELKDVVDNRRKNDYYRGVWLSLHNFFCLFVAEEPKDKNKEFLKALEEESKYSPIPEDLARRLTINKEFHNYPLRKMNSMINFLEKAFASRWKAFYEEKNREYRNQKRKRQSSRWDIERVVRGNNAFQRVGKEWISKYGDNRAGIMNEIKKRMKKLYPKPLPKKPKLKTKFTKQERKNILDYRENNYPDMVSAIYSLFKKKGLLDPSLCAYLDDQQKAQQKKSIEDRKQLIFTVLQKGVIRSLGSRFESLEKSNNE